LFPTSISDIPQPDIGNTILVAPNPISSNFRVIYKLGKPAPVEFSLYNSRGKLINRRMEENTTSLSGEFNWTIDRKLASGEYYISMQQKGGKVATCKLIKTK
jgi:hypothetical protein